MYWGNFTLITDYSCSRFKCLKVISVLFLQKMSLLIPLVVANKSLAISKKSTTLSQTVFDMQHPSRAWQKMARIKLLWKKHFSYVSLAQCGNYQMSTLSWILTYEGHMREVGIVDNFFEKFQRFMHSIDTSIFAQNLIILGHGNHEENTIHIVKTVNPFLAFWTLASNVKHVKNQTFVFEFNLKTWQIPIRDKDFSFVSEIIKIWVFSKHNQGFAKKKTNCLISCHCNTFR